MLYDLESHAKDGRCGLSRNEDICRFEGKLIEKQTLRVVYSPTYKDHSTASIQCKANSFTIAAAVFYLLIGQ